MPGPPKLFEKARRLHHQGGVIQDELSFNTDVKLTPGNRAAWQTGDLCC
jgi:hypothetical protein